MNASKKCFLLCIAMALAIVCAAVSPCSAQAPNDLGVLDGFSHSAAYASNASGQTVGMSFDNEIDGGRAFLWLPQAAWGLSAGMHELGGSSGYACSKAVDINTQGEVIGTCWNGGDTDSRTFLWLPEAAYGMTAGFHLLDGLPGEAKNWVVDINDAGYIVGNSAINIGGIEEPWFQTRGFLWYNGTVTALTMDDGAPITFDTNYSCHYVNQSGQVIGQFDYYPYPDAYFSIRRAVLWDGGATTILDDGMSFGEAIGINDNGEVVGRWGEGREVFLYLPQAAYGLEAGLHQLAAEADRTVVNQIFTYGINNAGQIVGWNSPGSQYVPDPNGEGSWVSAPGVLWIWQNGSFTDISTVDVDDAYFYINSSGQVAGSIIDVLWDDDWNYLGWSVQGCCWSQADGFKVLDTLGGTMNEVYGINDGGQPLGCSYLADDAASHACLWGAIAPPEPESALTVSDATVTIRNPKTLSVTVLIGNPSATETAYDVTVTAAGLGGVDTNSSLPLVFGAVKPGATKKCTLQFKGVPSGEQTLIIGGTSSLGDFSSTQSTLVP
ncbi:MAG: hypothetical protein ABFD69_12285 [Candidatus Sumerlaeia bacterium]